MAGQNAGPSIKAQRRRSRHAQHQDRSHREGPGTGDRRVERPPGRRTRPAAAGQAGALEREGTVLHRAARTLRQDCRGDRGSRRRHRGAHHGARRRRRGNRAGGGRPHPPRCLSAAHRGRPLASRRAGRCACEVRQGRAQVDRRSRRRRAMPTPATCSPAFRAPQTRTSGWSRRTCRPTADRPTIEPSRAIAPAGQASAQLCSLHDRRRRAARLVSGRAKVRSRSERDAHAALAAHLRLAEQPQLRVGLGERALDAMEADVP